MNYLRHCDEAKEILSWIKSEILQLQRPANEIILDDYDLQKFLKCSKRKTAELRERRVITFMKPDGKVYYRLSDVLNYLDKHKAAAIEARF
jgi:hypothetical protein